MDVSDYEYLWRDTDAGWALIRVAPVPGRSEPRYVIENTRTREALVIEDDALYAAVKREMFRRGVSVISREEANLDPPRD